MKIPEHDADAGVAASLVYDPAHVSAVQLAIAQPCDAVHTV